MKDQVAEEIKVRRLVESLRWTLWVLLIAVVSGALVLWVRERRSGLNEKAFALLFESEQMLSPKAEDIKYTEVATWDDVKKKKFQDGLESVVKQYPDSVAAALAGLHMGRFQYSLGAFEAAEKNFQSVIQSFKPNVPEQWAIVSMAYEGLASTHESRNNFEKASEVFSAATALKLNPLKPLAYLGLGRNLEKLGKNSEARTAYEKLIKEYPSSEYEKRARALLALTPQG